jgi:hypothetical protein
MRRRMCFGLLGLGGSTNISCYDVVSLLTLVGRVRDVAYQQGEKMDTMLSPGVNSFTSSPTFSTVPTNSWP